MNGQLIYSVRCTSPEAEYFRIEREVRFILIKDFDNIVQNLPSVKTNLSNFVSSKKEFLRERLVSIKKNLISIFKMTQDRIYKRNNFSKKDIMSVKHLAAESSIPIKSKSNEKFSSSEIVKSRFDNEKRVKSSQRLDYQIKDLKKILVPYIKSKPSDSKRQENIERDSNFNSLQTINIDLIYSSSHKTFRPNEGYIPSINQILSPNTLNAKDTIKTARDEKTRNFTPNLLNTISENKIVVSQKERVFRSKHLKNFKNVNLKTTFNTINDKKEIESSQAENFHLFRTKYSANNEFKKSMHAFSTINTYDKEKSQKSLLNFSKKIEAGNTLFNLHAPMSSDRCQGYI